jgi:photosystem II stability/assembly factor-like uncharacterized protein
MRVPVRLLTAALTAVAFVPLPAPARATGGGVWTPTLAATSAWDNLSAFPDGTAYATVGVVTTSGDAVPTGLPRQQTGSVGFFKSTDFARTWTPVAPPPHASGGTSNLYVRFASPTVGYATYGNPPSLPPDPTGKLSRTLCVKLSTTFRTADGGTTWTPLCEPHLASGEAMGIGQSPLAVGPDGNTVLLAGTAGSTKNADGCDVPTGAVAFSTDAGASWRRTALPSPYVPTWTVKAYDSRTALVLAYKMSYTADCGGYGEADGLFLTNDSGRTWKRVYSCPVQPVCTTAGFVTRKRIVVGRTNGSTAYTNDAGKTWHTGQRLADPVNDQAAASSGQATQKWWYWAQAFSFSDAYHGYASTRGGGTWRTEDGGRTWKQERSHECVYYPYGVGEEAAASPDVSITGGPGMFSARRPSTTDPGPCHPGTANVPAPAVPPNAVVAGWAGGALHLDGTVTRG